MNKKSINQFCVSITFCLFFIIVFFCSYCYAYTEYTVKDSKDNIIKVGQLDSLLGKTKLNNSGDQVEFDWVVSVLETMVDDVNIFLEKKYDVSETNWHKTIESNSVYALDLKYYSDYFLIKTGNNKNNNQNFTHFLFQNNESFDWAVVDLTASFGEGYTIKNIGKVSHVNEYSTVAVPESSTLFLLFGGLLGLGFACNRVRKIS